MNAESKIPTATIRIELPEMQAQMISMIDRYQDKLSDTMRKEVEGLCEKAFKESKGDIEKLAKEIIIEAYKQEICAQVFGNEKVKRKVSEKVNGMVERFLKS